MSEQKPHEALALPLSQRVDYLVIVASMAGVDVKLKTEETEQLKALCKALGLPSEETKKVLFASQTATTAVERHLEGLKDSPLRFTLLSDCVALAYADGKYEGPEQAEVRALAAQLGVTEDQVKALEELVSTTHAASSGGAAQHSRGRELAEQLAGAGIPIGVLGAATALGLEATGAATGLAALGVGLGVATGFGAVFGLGVGTYYGVRWLRKRLADAPSGA